MIAAVPLPLHAPQNVWAGQNVHVADAALLQAAGQPRIGAVDLIGGDPTRRYAGAVEVAGRAPGGDRGADGSCLLGHF
jgi:hypothetical protein